MAASGVEQNSVQPVPPPQAGAAFILIAAILWSTSGFFAKAPHFADWPGPLLAFWRAIFALVILVPLVRQPTWSIGLIPMSLCFAAMNYTYLTAMVRGEATNAIWLQNTAPTWVFLVNLFVLREPTRRGDWWLFALSSLGVGFILWFELQGARADAVAYGLASGGFYAGIILCLRRLRHLDSAWLVAVNHLVAAIVLLPWAVAGAHAGLSPSGIQWLYLAGFGALQMGLPYMLFARGLKSTASHVAAGIGLLEPLLVPVWVYVAWRDAPGYQPPSWWTILGGSGILAGLLMNHLGGATPPSSDPVAPGAAPGATPPSS